MRKTSKKIDKDRYNKVPNLTWKTTWESDKTTRKHHKRESPAIPSRKSQGSKNRQYSITKTNTKHKDNLFLPFDPTPGVEGVSVSKICATMLLHASFPLI